MMFHDCVPGLDGRGGCDGCLNWRNMGNIFNRKTKKDARTGEDYEPVTEKVLFKYNFFHFRLLVYNLIHFRLK